MFDFAGILPGDLFRNPQLDQEPDQHPVAVMDLLCDHIPFVRQGDQIIRAHVDISVFSELLHGNADGTLGHVQPCRDIDRPGITFFLQQNQDLLQIVFS